MSARRARLNKLDFSTAYPRLIRALKRAHGSERAVQLAVGGNFNAYGILELEVLKFFGLRHDFYVIDVGCGSGRLARPLSGYLSGQYLGTDVVEDLVTHARAIVRRADWRFEVVDGLAIPERDAVADFVCFFSVFTHLLHEQSYVYLREAKRVLKPGGKIVFSYLDFDVAAHWSVFEANIRDLGVNSHPLNMFIGRDAVKAWAQRLELKIEAMEPGDKPFLPLSQPVVFDNGSVAEHRASFGQSICVLRKGA